MSTENTCQINLNKMLPLSKTSKLKFMTELTVTTRRIVLIQSLFTFQNDSKLTSKNVL